MTLADLLRVAEGLARAGQCEIVDYHRGIIMGRSALHPSEHLAEQLQALDMSAAELSRQLRVPTNRITAILNGQRAMTGDTALRLGHFFGTSAEFWLNLQKLYELHRAEEKAGETIKDLPTLAKAAKKTGDNSPPQSS
jgi:addiction module HigA family antidote